MKIAVAGKGGVGKTFVSATLSRILAKDGYNVLAVDADPNLNLAYSLGVGYDVADNIVPLSENNDLVKEKTGVAPEEALGNMFNMNPRVSDIVDRFGVTAPDNVKLLVMGTVKGGGTGCMCGANAMLRVLIQHMLIQRGEVLVMDMVAGLEHLGRGTARRMDAMLVVIEPRMKSVDTVKRILKMAEQIEVETVLAVGNKVIRPKDEEFIRNKMGELNVPVISIIPYDQAVADADMEGVPTIDYDPETPAVKAVRELEKYLIERFKP
ncbi:cobalamin biosynthesis protein CobN [Candidatus Bathyarchaeota archaeon]|nr:cobalamin biosynthesis protein CobN [Candidatus Bathyarchaeota archaeon]